MKYIKQYNESIKDFLKPKSEEDIIKNTEKLSHLKKIELGKQYKIKRLIDNGKQELLKDKEYLKTLNIDIKINIGKQYNIPELIKMAEDEIIDDIKSSSPIDKIKKGARHGYLWAVKDGVKNLPNRRYSFKDALYWAVYTYSIDIVKYLIDNVVLKPEDIDYAVGHSTYYAKQSGDADKIMKNKTIVELLRNKKLQILNSKQDYNKLLKYGCEQGKLDVVKDAIENGADINYQYNNYLSDAISSRNTELVKYLLDNGATGGDTDSPIRYNDVEMLKLLQEYGYDIIYSTVDFNLFEWIEKGTHDEMIKYLITQKPDLKILIQNKIDKLNNLIKKNQKYLD